MNPNITMESININGTPADHAEFERLVERTQRQAYNMAYRMTGNRDDAEDLTQEAYLRAYRSFGTYNRQLPFESWYFRILSNLFIDLMRRRPKQKPLSLISLSAMRRAMTICCFRFRMSRPIRSAI